MTTAQVPIVYTLSTCPTCLKLKQYLDDEGIQYEERQVDENQQWLDEANAIADIVPIVVHPDGRVEVGFAGEIG